MAKQLSLEQARTFFKNLATALLPGSKFALWVESTPKKNKFTAVILPKDYAPQHFLSTVRPKFLTVYPSFDDRLIVNGIDAILEKASPKLMLRPGHAVDPDWVAETFKCDPNELYRLILRSIRIKSNEAIKRHWKNEPDGFAIKAIDKFSSDSDLQTPSMRNMEELYLWADLNAS